MFHFSELVHHAEKPEHYIGNLINCGVYVISKSSIEAFLQARLHRAKVNNFLYIFKKTIYLKMTFFY